MDTLIVPANLGIDEKSKATFQMNFQNVQEQKAFRVRLQKQKKNTEENSKNVSLADCACT